MPEGSSIILDNLPVTDTAGYAGLKDEVDLHTWTLLKGVVLSTLFGVVRVIRWPRVRRRRRCDGEAAMSMVAIRRCD